MKPSFSIQLCSFLVVAACAVAGDLPDLTKICPGFQTPDNRVVIYRSSQNTNFIWGIIFPPYEGGGFSYASGTHTIAKLRNGASIELVTNLLTVAKDGKKTTKEMKQIGRASCRERV